jgi:arylsulfatase A-like enzyme
MVVDDMGWGDVGYHGSEIATPNIDALAASGVNIDRAYNFPICSPTRAALMTGRNPLQYGIDAPLENDAMLPANLKLLPEYLREQGYQTWMVGKWHLGMARVSAMPNARGFDSFYGFLGGFVDFYTHTYFGGLDWQRDGKSLREEGHATDLLTKEALRLLDQNKGNKPFFMYLTYNAPHIPLQYPPGADGTYASIKNPDRRVYAQMLTHLDSRIGAVMDRLKRLGIAENTIVVFMSDNGGSPDLGSSNGALRGGKGSIHEGGVRVPAMLSWPGKLKPSKLASEPIFTQDWLPTLLESVGISYDKAAFDGQSRWPALNASGLSTATKPVIIGSPRGKAVYSWPFKLVRMAGSGQSGDALYNVVDDPLEKTDIASTNPALVNRLGGVLDELPKIPSKGASSPTPETLFRDKNGAFIHDLRLPETREPWAEAADRN